MIRYRRYVSSHDITAKAQLVRQVRGRKRIDSAQGQAYNLDEVFEALNRQFFYGLLARPQMTWSRSQARKVWRITILRTMQSWSAGSSIIVRVPRCAVEYIVYHEMLHLKHPVKLRGSRRCVHGPEFQAEEKLFPELDKAKLFLKTL